MKLARTDSARLEQAERIAEVAKRLPEHLRVEEQA